MAVETTQRSPTGGNRRWTLRGIIRGEPIDWPTHAMLIHFPIAFYIGALGLDVLSRLGRFPAAPLAGTWLVLASLAGFLAAAVTGLVDRSFMRPRSKIRKVATRHMLLQLAAGAIFLADAAIRWAHRHAVHASVGWIALEAVGVLVMTVGADLGGQMVYRMGYRVGPADD